MRLHSCSVGSNTTSVNSHAPCWKKNNHFKKGQTCCRCALFPLRTPEGKCKVRDSSYSRIQSIFCNQWPRRVECYPLQINNTLNSTHPSIYTSIHPSTHPSVHPSTPPLRAPHGGSCRPHGSTSTSCPSETYLLVGVLPLRARAMEVKVSQAPDSSTGRWHSNSRVDWGKSSYRAAKEIRFYRHPR